MTSLPVFPHHARVPFSLDPPVRLRQTRPRVTLALPPRFVFVLYTLLVLAPFAACGSDPEPATRSGSSSSGGSSASSSSSGSGGSRSSSSSGSATNTIDRALAGTTWNYSNSGWTYSDAHDKKYEDDNFTLTFNADGTGTWEDAYSNQYYVYNVITDAWQPNASNVKDLFFSFNYSASSSSTITLTNYGLKDTAGGTTVTITDYTPSSLYFNDHSYTRQ